MPWDRSELDPADDWELFDGKEDVVFHYFDAAADEYDTADALEFDALCRELGYTVVTLSSGETTAVDTVIHCQAENFVDETRPPRRNDRIARYEGVNDTTYTYYTIQTVRLQTFGTRYRFECTRQYPSE